MLIARHILGLIPQPFDRIEFRAVGRQRQQVNTRRKLRILGTGMKPCLVPDDHMLGLRVTIGNLLQEAPA